MTTDPQHELFDILTPDGRPTGRAKPRGQVHRDGDWHGALHIWIGGVGDEGPFALYQRRSLTKDTWPGKLDVAVGGHLRAGETLLEAAREGEEEIGLPITLDALTRIGRRFASWSGPDGVRDNEVQEVFALRSDAPLTAYRLHPEEVDALVACPLEPLRQLLRGEIGACPARSINRAGALTAGVVNRADFITVRDDYADRALAALGAVLRGGEPITPFELSS